jgi:GR25 family glycosyltransferase involved in LPS biosynthesis
MSLGKIINGFFDHVFIISLARSKDRQDEIIKELKKYNIKFSFVEGVDGWQLDLDKVGPEILDKEKNIRITKLPIAPGELGCSLSVLKVCKKVVEERLQSVLILQDDVRVIADNVHQASKLFSAVNFKWDMLYLGHSSMFMKMPWSIKWRLFTLYPLKYFLNRKINKSPKEIRNTFRRPYNQYWSVAGEHNGGYAYGLSYSGAKKLTEAFSPVFAPDDMTFRYCIKKGILKAYSPEFFLFYPREDLTSVVGARPSWGIDWANK